ncbi:hypothetical protein AOQ84DRAFT_408764, partial [Glonium stellatum]
SIEEARRAPDALNMQLSEDEKKILDRQPHGLETQTKSRRGSILEYATSLDKLILLVSSISAVVSGALNPLLTVVYGQLVGVFDGFTAGTVPASHLKSKISTYALYYVYLGIAIFVFTYISTIGFYFCGERMTRSLRRAYLKAILRQNMAFFDLLAPGEVPNHIMSASIGGAYAVKYHKRSRVFYNRASGLVEEAISSVRYVIADAGAPDVKARNIVSTMMAWKNAMPCLAYALSFWAGSIYLVKGQVSVSDVATTTLVITIGGWAIARVAPSIQAFTSSIASAGVVLKAIARRSPHDPFV